MKTKLVPANSDKALQAIFNRKYNGLEYKTDEVALIKELRSFFNRNSIRPIQLSAYRNLFDISSFDDGYVISFWTFHEVSACSSCEETVYSWKKQLKKGIKK